MNLQNLKKWLKTQNLTHFDLQELATMSPICLFWFQLPVNQNKDVKTMSVTRYEVHVFL